MQSVNEFFKDRRGIAVNREKCRAHITSAIARGWPEHPWCRPHKGVAHICGGGPSVAERRVLNKIRRATKRKNAFVCTVNKTHDHFLELPQKRLGPKIVSDFTCLFDPKPVVSTYVTPRKGTQYFIASQCDPKVLDVFEKPDVSRWMFHHAGEERDLMDDQQHVTPPIFSTIGLESILILYRLGFRAFHLWAMEGSYSGDNLHGYKKPFEYRDKQEYIARNTVTGEEYRFLSNAHMACQVDDFQLFAKFWDLHVSLGHYDNIVINVHGEGYLPCSAGILNQQYKWIRHADSVHERLRSGDKLQGCGGESTRARAA